MLIVAKNGDIVNLNNVLQIRVTNGLEIIAVVENGSSYCKLADVDTPEDARKLLREITDGYANGVKVIYLGEENR